MKRHYIRTLLIAVLLFGSKLTYGQFISIDSIKVIPEPRTVNDEIKAVIYSTFASGSCGSISSQAVYYGQGTSVNISLDYVVGIAPYICHSVDTIIIGYLDEGAYDLHVYVTMNNDPFSEVSAVTFFVVDGPLGVVQPANTNNKIHIYPNPFEEELTILTDGVFSLELFNFLGQKTAILQDKSVSGIPLQFSSLAKGVYLLILTDESGNKFSQKIVRQ